MALRCGDQLHHGVATDIGEVCIDDRKVLA